MSKKNNGEAKSAPAPVISKIPLPISDSPLVIDLPDGQKLVVGKMIQGSVIEVATWRGTGRPDSRTSRLMLGMSIGDVNPTPEEKVQTEASGGAPTIHAATDAPAEPKSQAQAWLDYLSAKYPALKFLKGKKIPQFKVSKPAVPKKTKKSSEPSLKASKFGGIKTIKSRKSASKSTSPTLDSNTPSFESSADDDISAWLDQISEKARVRVEAESAVPAKKGKAKAPVSLEDVFSKGSAAKKTPARRTNAAKKSASAPKKRK